MIVTDYSMHGMTGNEYAGEVLKIRPDMPVILCTGYTEKGTESSARELGIRGYALKICLSSSDRSARLSILNPKDIRLASRLS